MSSESESTAESSSTTPQSAARSFGVDLDASIPLRAQRGDRSAMETLVLHHQPAISRLLWRFVRTQNDLDDLVQETFLRMVRGLPQWKARQPFAHWLLRIATNTGRDYFRRQSVRRRWQVDTGEADPDASAPEAVDSSTDPAARAAADDVKVALAQLSADERALLTLHHLEGWGLSDIAAQFGWTVTATKLRAWRARRQLRRFLEQQNFP